MRRLRQTWLAGVLALLACEARPPLSVGAPVDAGTTPQALACASAPISVPGKVGGYTFGTSDPTCAAVMNKVQWKGAAAGAPCTSGLDCTPACCACPAPSSRTALTSWCLDGQCATPQEACCVLAGTPTNSCGTEPGN
jgi:hypothetical protein